VIASASERRANESERQALIRAYLALRSAGEDVPRQKVLLRELEKFELGWPERADGRERAR
jgi:hypothetical protein